jgi:hypothetical protein
MKQPRTSDFDPNAKRRELKSPMKDFPAIETPGQIQVRSADRLEETIPPVRPVRDVLAVPVAASSRRKIKSRHPFDIYEDQVEELKKLSLEDRMRGESGSMSAMVREALDDYIAKVRAQSHFLDGGSPES